MSVEDAEARGIKAGDTVRCFNDFGSMLRIAQPMQGYMPGVVGIPHGVHSVFDESDPENIIDRGGSEQMLSDGLQSNYFPQVDGTTACSSRLRSTTASRWWKTSSAGRFWPRV